jgi:O-antigen/teichoic acid export membrane protein
VTEARIDGGIDSGANQSVLGAGSLVAAGMMTMNVLVYAFTLLSAHTLAPSAFGGLGAVLAILIMVSVGALALQATGARRIATAEHEHRATAAHDLLATARVVAFALAGGLLVASPILRLMLDVPWAVALLVPVAVVPLTVLGGFAGVLQGCRAWRGLALVFLGLGAGRLTFGVIALLLDDSLTAAVAGVTAGAFAPAIVGWIACHRLLGGEPGSAHRVVREVWENAHTLLAFFALTNLDVLIARSLLDGDASGIYSAGAILTKSCLFLPQFVIIVAFPGIAEEQARDQDNRDWLKPLGLVGLLGAGVSLGAVLLPDLTVKFVGGEQYVALADYVWLFAVEGTIFALLQLVLYRQIARRALVAPSLWAAVTSLLALSLALTAVGVELDQRELVVAVIVVSVLAMGPVSRARARLTA